MSSENNIHYPRLILSDGREEINVSALFQNVTHELEKYNHNYRLAHTKEAALAISAATAAASTAVRSNRDVEAQWHRSAGLPSPYPERTASMAPQ
ncbi:hypothetical protein Q8V93_003393 [Enterobacter asburiae]|nr:hypothetical protein [Enterobacter asburiae]